MNQIERLRVAGLLAPIARDGGGRTYKVTDADGNVINQISGAELASALAKREEIELSVGTEARPLRKRCECCGLECRVPPHGRVGRICSNCDDPTITTCTCGANLSKSVHCLAAVIKRRGVRPLCSSCARRKYVSTTTPEQRSASARKAVVARSLALLHSWLVRNHKSAATTNAKMTPEQKEVRAYNAAAIWADLTPEQRTEALRLARPTRRGHAKRVKKTG